jgi:cytoskeletal protein CcmA (bactofilin family)
MAEVRIKEMEEHEIDTILAEDIDFEGHLTFKKPLMIKGKFKGEIKSTSSLYIGEKALVEATTEAAVISSKGKHKGDIVGHSRVELHSTAQVDGDITTPDFIMESGCKFNGYCNMGGAPRKDGPQPRQQGQSQQKPPPPSQQQPAQQLAQQPAPAQSHGPEQHPGQQSTGQQAQGQPPQGQQQKPPAAAAGQGGQGGQQK